MELEKVVGALKVGESDVCTCGCLARMTAAVVPQSFKPKGIPCSGCKRLAVLLGSTEQRLPWHQCQVGLHRDANDQSSR